MATSAEAAYLKLSRDDFEHRVHLALNHLRSCTLCPRRCRANRLKGPGDCRTGHRAVVSSAGPHFGEESPISGRHGSGTIFFSGCNLECVFCQNWQISQRGEGREVDAAELAETMLELQEVGCHNINWVSPSHVVPQLLEALNLAAQQGLRLPIVYNSGGYDAPEALALMDGVVDIYLPDVKFADSRVARRYLGVNDYAEVNQSALREMQRQVGVLVLDAEGVAQRGLLVRHLVLPQNLAGTDRILRFLAEQLSRNTSVNLMDQYRPCYRAGDFPPLDRRPTGREFREALDLGRRLGLNLIR